MVIQPTESDFRGTYKVLFGLAPPLGLLYLTKILEEDGNNVDFLDFSIEEFNKQKISSSLKSIDAVLIMVLSVSVRRVHEIVNIIKEEDSEIPIIVGGPHCTLFPRRAIKETNADICVQGDGEGILIDIIKSLNDQNKLSRIPGVFFKTKTAIENGPPFKPIENLDIIPFPSRHLVKKYLYGQAYNPRIKEGEFTSILTSRGCPFKCKFCSRNAVSLNMFRIRSTKNIIEELREIHEMGYKYLGIMDDSALYNKKQANEIFDALIKENIEMKIYITATRADSADKDLYLKMKKAGVVSIQFGLESGNQEVLDFYNKKTTLDEIKNAVMLSHEVGFFTSGTFVLGAPFETKKHFYNTVKFAKSLPLESASFLPLRYRAYTDIWLDAVNKGNLLSDEYEIQADSSKGLGLYTEKELLRLCQTAQQMFYLSPKYLLNLLRSSLEKNDFSILRMLTSIGFSRLKNQINPFKKNSQGDFKFDIKNSEDEIQKEIH